MPRLIPPLLLLLLPLLLVVVVVVVAALSSAAVIRSPSPSSSSNSSVPIAFSARYAVRWMDPSQSRFGATINLTFTDPTLFSSRWQARFRMADNGTAAGVAEYWGSWSCVELPRGWYQLLPREDLRLNNASQVYFSFNGRWNVSRQGDWNTTKLASTAFELQVATANTPPVIYQLRDAGEFANEPVPFEIPAAPFGNFIRSPGRPGIPVARMLGSSLPLNPSALAKPQSSNFLGLYIVVPLLAFVVLVWIIASLQSWRWRKLYRMRLEQLALKSQAIAAKYTEDDTPPIRPDYGNAYAGYYMMLDGAWDNQIVHDGDEDSTNDHCRPYSIAPVVTDPTTYYNQPPPIPTTTTTTTNDCDAANAPQTPGTPSQPRRTTLLIPGKEYRMTLLEKGVPMPQEWLPPGLQAMITGLPAQSSTQPFPPMPSVAPQQPVYSSSAPTLSIPPPPAIPPAVANPSAGGSPAVKSRSLAAISVRKDTVPQPPRQVAQPVPAVEGAVVVPTPQRETVPPPQLPTITELQPYLAVADNAVSPLSPGWPIVEDDYEGDAYSPPENDVTALANSENGDIQAIAVSLSSSNDSAKSKPLPVKGWNMI